MTDTNVSKIRIVKYIFIAVFISYSLNLFSQKEGNIWYFSNHAGLDFNSGSPVPLTNSAMGASEGCSSISDTAGNILFYTDGIEVYNKNHQVMANGTGLMAGWSSSQAAMIVKQPCADNIYYIFTTPHQGLSAEGLRYSIVDMNLQGGLGQVTQKNVLVFQPVLEKMVAVRHINDIDIWIVTHQWNSDNFAAFLLTENGLSTTPVISKTGIFLTGPPQSGDGNAIGCMKASTDGSRLSMAVHYDHVHELYHFDKATGKVSNPITLSPFALAYSLEFSPNGKWAYFQGYDTAANHHLLYQADISSWTFNDINNSITLIDTIPQHQSPTGGITGSSLQLGPDGNIYVGVVLGGYVSAITNPDLQGQACGFVDSFVSLAGKIGTMGFPNLINDQYLQHKILYSNKCAGDSTYFSLSNTVQFTTVTWHFGGGAPPSGLTNPTHIYSTPGLYTVIAIVNNNGVIDTVTRNINIYPSINITDVLGADTVLCPGATVDLEVDIPCADYLWSTGSIDNKITVSQEDLYWVEINSTCGVLKDSILIEYSDMPEVSLPADTVICEGDTLHISAQSNTNNVLWSTGDTTLFLNIPNPSQYHITASNECGTASDSILISPLTFPVLNIKDTSICFGEQVELRVMETGSSLSLYSWNDGSQSNTMVITNEGLYWVEIRKGNCAVIDSAFIVVNDCNDSIIIGVPNAFSPNGDGLNDQFNILLFGEIQELEIMIFNRWGEKVFESNNLNNWWDGRYKNMDQPVGVYAYVLYIRDINQKVYQKKGNITLLR